MADDLKRRLAEFDWANKNPVEAARREREKRETAQLTGFPEAKHVVNGKEQKQPPK